MLPVSEAPVSASILGPPDSTNVRPEAARSSGSCSQDPADRAAVGRAGLGSGHVAHYSPWAAGAERRAVGCSTARVGKSRRNRRRQPGPCPATLQLAAPVPRALSAARRGTAGCSGSVDSGRGPESQAGRLPGAGGARAARGRECSRAPGLVHARVCGSGARLDSARALPTVIPEPLRPVPSLRKRAGEGSSMIPTRGRASGVGVAPCRRRSLEGWPGASG